MIDQQFAMTIGGKAVSSAGSIAVANPATGRVNAEAPDCSADQLDAAVLAARAAQPGWGALTADARREYLHAFADAIMAEAADLQVLLTSEQGKPALEAEREVGSAAAWLRGTAQLDLPETINEDSEARFSRTRWVPLGVVGAIVPWNFPLLLAMFKVAPALLAGNAMVLKPSPYTPLTTLALGRIGAGVLPAGVLNVISGGDSLGPLLSAHPGIDKVTFTGSTATGRRVLASAAESLKRVTLELGGNDAAIVLPDADVEAIAPELFWAAFRNNGQICIATKRLYVHRSIHARLREALVAYARTVRVGEGSSPGVRLGPLNNRVQFDRVQDLIADCRAQGHDIIQIADAPSGPGHFVPVTLVDNPPETSRIVQEEQFGPVLPLLVYDDLTEAIERVNASEYGLGCSIWGTDLAQADEVAGQIACGTVWINETQHLSPRSVFAGWKQSGFGLEGGEEGLREFAAPRTTTIRKVAT